MPHKSFEELLIKKAYEVSYAVFRLTGILESRQELRFSLESNAARLLEEAVRGDINAASRHIRVLEYMLRLGGDTGVLNPNHVNLIINELANLESDIAGQLFNLQVNLQKDIQSAIQNTNQSASQSAIQDYGQKSPIINNIQSAIQNTNQSASQSAIENYGEDYGPESEVIIDEDYNLENMEEYDEQASAERREAILQFIKDSGVNGCRFKDIFDGLGDKLNNTGERTIRYDLQSLIEQGIIEKYGPGGAYTYYRARVYA